MIYLIGDITITKIFWDLMSHSWLWPTLENHCWFSREPLSSLIKQKTKYQNYLKILSMKHKILNKTYIPSNLDNVLHRKLMFKLIVKSWNIHNHDKVYSIVKIIDDEELIICIHLKNLKSSFFFEKRHKLTHEVVLNF